MSKALKNSNLSERGATRALVALSLSFTLVAFGCTTDRTLGNGDPVTTPGLRSSPTGGGYTGTESAPTVPPSMTSSSSIGSDQALPVVTVRNGLSRADQAAAIMAQHQPRERYLGPAWPGFAGQPYASDGMSTGQFQNPAYRTNPQLTVNSSLTSGPSAVISSGAGGAGAVSDVGAIIGGTGVTGAVATGTTSIGTTASAPLFSTGTTGLSTTAATSLPTGTLAATATPTTSPTAFSAITPSPLVSTSPALAESATAARATTRTAAGSDINGTLIAGTATNGTTANLTSGATASTPTSATASTASSSTSANLTAGGARTTLRAPATAASASANPVRITTDASGRRVITNVPTASRNQQ